MESEGGGQGDQMFRFFQLILPQHKCVNLETLWPVHPQIPYLVLGGSWSFSVHYYMLLYERDILKQFSYKGKNFPRLQNKSGVNLSSLNSL